MNGYLQRVTSYSDSWLKTTALVAGLALLPTFSASARPWGYNLDPDLQAVEADIAAEITDIQFTAGDDPNFAVFFTVDAANLGENFKVGGKFRIQVNKARIGPGQAASSAGTFAFAPRTFDGPGPYKAIFRLRGKDWGGVLPEATYKAALKVALHKGGKYYRDLNMDDNQSQMSTRYYTELVAKEVTVEGKRQDEAVKLSLNVVNAGNRPSGDLKVKWWTLGQREVVEHVGFEAEAEELVEYTFERPEDQNVFGRKVKVLFHDHMGILRLRKVRKIQRGSSPIVEIDPDETDPTPDDRLEGVDYHVSEVHANPFCLGDGLWVFSSTVTNEGKTDGDEYGKIKWENIRWGYDGSLNSGQGVGLDFRPINHCIKPLEVNESQEILASVKLLVADDINPENYNVSGTMQVTPVAGEEQPEDNMVEFGLQLCAPQEENPTPPEMIVGDIHATLHYPKYAGRDGALTVALALQNNGGAASTVTWSLSVDGLEYEDQGSEVTFVAQDVGSGSSVEEQFITFQMPEGNWAADDAETKRPYIAVVRGTSTYGRDGQLEGPEFEAKYEFEVGKYPRPDVDVSIYVKDSAGNEYIPLAQVFSETESRLVARFQIENNGQVPIHEDDPIKVEYGIEGFIPTESFSIDRGLGREIAQFKLETTIGCDYWNSDRNPLQLTAGMGPSETNDENNAASMGLKFASGASPDC